MSWKAFQLGELVKVKHGFAFKGEHFSDQGNGIVLTPGNFHEKGGFRARPGKDRYYSDPVAEEWVLQPGDLIVAMTEQGPGLLGSAAIIPEGERFLHNQRIGRVLPLDEEVLDLRFLYRVFNLPNVRGQINGSASGTKVRHTAPERIYRVTAKFPEKPTQSRIADIAQVYDDLIENNLRRIKLLEEAARLLYREWFVHLRFPGNEIAATGDGLPDGWIQSALSTIASVVRGRSYKGSELSETEGRQFVNLKCFVRYGGFRESGLKRYTGPFKERQCVEPSDIVMAVTDMTQERMIVAQAARIPKTVESGAVISMDVVKLEPGPDTDKEWFYFFLRFSGFSERVSRYGTGATVVHLSPSLIENHMCVVPRKEIQIEFGDLVRPLMNQIDVLLAQNNALERARDLLLPRLMSGEIEV